MKNRLLLWLAVATLLVVSSPVSAQEPAANAIDITQLTKLYDSWLQEPANEWINQRIAEERDKMRQQIEAEIAAEETEVDQLKQRLRERKIDLQLLTQTGAVKTTGSHAELLAKKAVLEERIQVLESVIPLQENRLQLLRQQQRLAQFGTLITIGLFLLLLIAVFVVESIIRRFLLTQIKNDNKRYAITKVFTSTVYILLFTGTVLYLLAENPGVITSFAIIGAGIAVALQDLIKDFIGWLFIVRRSMFALGDRVSIGKHTGEIIDIGMLRFTIHEVGSTEVLEHTGKTVSLPNSMVLMDSVVNHSATSDYVKAEIKLIITFESNRKRAEEILVQILEEETDEFSRNELRQYIQNTRKYYLSRQPIGTKVFKNIAGSGFEFTLRFSVPIGLQRTVTSVVAGKIMDAFDSEPDIKLAYNTYRIVQ